MTPTGPTMPPGHRTPEPTPRPGWPGARPALVGLLGGGAAFALYLLTIAPSITVAHGSADSGELVTVADALGVAHAPGYGLYLLLARGALWALGPLEEPALRTNVLSALLSAGAVGVLVATMRRWASLPAALVAGAVAATAPVVWSQAIVTEVYALAALLAALSLPLAERVLAAPASTGRWAAFGFVLGLGAAHHPTGWVLAAALGGTVLVSTALGSTVRGGTAAERRSRARTGRRQLAAAAGAAALPLAVAALYLAWRADAAVAWGETDSLRGAWHHLSGADYRWLWEWSPAEAAETLPGSVRELVAQFPPPVWLLVPIGVIGWWEREPRLAAAWLAHACALVVLVTVYRAEGREPYLAGAVITGAVAAGFGLDVAIEVLGRLRARRPRIALLGLHLRSERIFAAVAGLLIAAAVVWTVETGRDTELRGDRTAEAQATALLTGAPADAVLHTSRDELTFPLWYLRNVRGLRPDVTIIDVRGLAPVQGPAAAADAPDAGSVAAAAPAGPGRAAAGTPLSDPPPTGH